MPASSKSNDTSGDRSTELHVRLETNERRYTFLPEDINVANRIGLTDTFDKSQLEAFRKVANEAGFTLVEDE